MTPAFRSVALASALAAISCGAMAAPIGFESVWPGNVDPNAGPRQLEKVEGLVFSFVAPTPASPGVGAWGYKAGMLSVADVLPDAWDTGVDPAECNPAAGVCNLTSFIMNRDRDPNSDGRIIELSLDPTVFGGRYIRQISFDLFYNTGNVLPRGGIVKVLNDDGSKSEVFEGFTGGQLFWKNVPLAVKNEEAYTRVQFDFGGNTLGLDNLDFTLTAAVTPPPPNGVPEPASYALVGLALLAAGSARRRKA